MGTEWRESAEDDDAAAERPSSTDRHEAHALWNNVPSERNAPREETEVQNNAPAERTIWRREEPTSKLESPEDVTSEPSAVGSPAVRKHEIAPFEERAGGADNDVADRKTARSLEDPDATDESRSLLEDDPITDLHIVGGRHSSGVYEAQLLESGHAYLKPEIEEGHNLRSDAVPDGTGYLREVAVYQVDRVAGFNLVPETVIRSEPQLDFDHASLQAKVPNEARPLEDYAEADLQRMAVLDYITGNLDRNPENYLTQADGRPAAIDHGLCLPEHDGAAIRSVFVAGCFNQELAPAVIDETRSIDPGELRGVFDRLGISDAATAGALARLAEVQTEGRITGAAWHGEIEYFATDKNNEIGLFLLRGRVINK